MTPSEIAGLITAIVTGINTLAVSYMLLYKGKREASKMEADERNEEETNVVSAVNLSLEGAEVSTKLLMTRIEELKRDIEGEKRARQEDALYFKRRIKEIDREARDYRMWAARLAKQVIEAGKIPVPFVSTFGDSDPLIQTISAEQEQLEKAKTARQEEIKNAETKAGSDTKTS